uniref:Dedicator of cytokinesis 10 n=1 Tax=Sinocyclocheilus rhinocerous TaxID=307959 RepID=A0A673IG99_9TELE
MWRRELSVHGTDISDYVVSGDLLIDFVLSNTLNSNFSACSIQTVQKMLKSNKQFCSKLGKYRMPFAWSVRSVFKDNQGTVDRESRFSPLFKQESNKISTEDLMKLITDVFYRAEKASKLQIIPGNLEINVDCVPMECPNCVTSSYVALRPFEDCGLHAPTVEVDEFLQDSSKFAQPYRVYKNHIYIYPKHLKYDSQKSFAKARNIAVYVEFRSSDEEHAKPLKCIYGKPGGPVFTTTACSTVLHHSQNPDFCDEVKIELPTHLHEKHHLLFSFYHVTCDINAKTSSKKKEALETPVGYAWLPLLKDGRVSSQDFSIPVSCTLPGGYLHIKELWLGRHENGSDVKWVDGGKPIFKVSTLVLSTVYTQDPHLNRFFQQCQKREADLSQAPTSNFLNCLKGLLSMERIHVIIRFLPVIFNQLFKVLTQNDTDEVSTSTTRVLVHILAKCHEENLGHYLHSYIKVHYMICISRPQRCFTFMDRGFTFKLISNYINMITASDNKMLCELKFEFIREVCNYEHYVPLSLPIPSARITVDFPEYILTEEFCRKHFLTGLLLRELGLALQDEQDLRHLALACLKNLMAKHSLDSRYAIKEKQARIASLYLPLYGLILDNMPRFFLRDLFPICLTASDQKRLQHDDGQNSLMKKVFDTYLLFFQINQSTSTLKHVFTALRLFIHKFPSTVFQGTADLCGSLCYEILKCCNHRSSSTQTEAAALLYFLMRRNFEFTKGKCIVRSHLQVIKSVSQLIADAGIGGSRFQQSLAIINNFANGDTPLKNTTFPAEVKDLTKRIRTVLMATSQMKEHEKDPEMLVDLQYSLANSYASTPELRRTWLESMAKIHVRNGDLSEAAMCYIHISALIAESLRRRGEQRTPALRTLRTRRCRITPHISEYELIAEINKPVIAVFEKRRDFKRLSELYYDIHRSYLKVTEVVHSEKRLFGRYYRVAFYGQGFFEEEESKEFIYKEPKLTGLSEISQRLLKLYSDKFGADNVKMIQDSNKVNPKDLDPRFAYIQVTYVVPYFNEKEQIKSELPINSHLCCLCCSAASSGFPFLKKRVEVVEQQSTEMNPIEVAIDEMSCKVSELNQLCGMEEVDMIRLQLKLQGSVSVKVNAGPMAYARAFLEEKNAKKYPDNQVKLLKEIFRQFADACGQALKVNERLIKEDQLEYQEEMKAHYKDMLTELSAIMNEQVSTLHPMH